MKDFVVSVSQRYGTLLFIWWYRCFVGKIVTINTKALHDIKTGPLVIVANHIAAYDSFMTQRILAWHNLPLSFMGVTKFHSPWLNFLAKIGVIQLIYFFCGVFVIVPKAGIEKNLETARKILKKKGRVFVYPEGSMNRKPQLLPFKLGAATLALTDKTPVLPMVFVETTDSRGKITFTISIGELIDTTLYSDPQQLTDVFYSTLSSMKKSIEDRSNAVR